MLFTFLCPEDVITDGQYRVGPQCMIGDYYEAIDETYWNVTLIYASFAVTIDDSRGFPCHKGYIYLQIIYFLGVSTLYCSLLFMEVSDFRVNRCENVKRAL